MKKLIFTLIPILSAAFIMIGADLPPAESETSAILKKHCIGYTIVEAGKGIDCNGDTVKLVKKYGFYELASHYETTSLQD